MHRKQTSCHIFHLYDSMMTFVRNDRVDIVTMFRCLIINLLLYGNKNKLVIIIKTGLFFGSCNGQTSQIIKK